MRVFRCLLISTFAAVSVAASIAQEPLQTAAPEAQVAALPANPAEDFRSRLAQAEREGAEGFAARTTATAPEFAEYLELLQSLIQAGDATAAHSPSAPEVRKEAARVEEEIRSFQPPAITPENGLQIYDRARSAEQLAATWVSILADFSRSERNAEDAAFNNLRRQQDALSQLQAGPDGTPREQWLLELQQLRVSAAMADYESARDSSLRDSSGRMEMLRVELEKKIAGSIRNEVTFPQSVLDQQLAEVQRQTADIDALGGRLDRALAQINTQIAAAGAGSADRYWLEARAGALQRQIQSVNFIRILLGVQARLWQERFVLWNGTDPDAVVAARRSITDSLAELQTWQPLVRGRLRELRDRQAAVVAGAPDPSARVPKPVSDAFSNEEAALNQLGDAFDSAMNLAALSRMDITEREESLGVTARFEQTVRRVNHLLTGIWAFPLFQLKDSVTVNGTVMDQTRSVTVGMIVTAFLILGIGAIFSARVCKWLAARLTRRFRLEQNTSVIVEKFTHYGLLIIFLLVALGIVRIPLTIFALLGGATAIAVGFGAQQLFNNLISGVILLFERPIRIGDRIELDQFSGTVMSIGSRCSRLVRPDGVEILIPNSLLLQNTIVNWTLSDNLCRQELLVGVSYGSPIETVAKLIEDALRTHQHVLKSPAPQVLFQDFGDSALKFRALYWIDSAVDGSVLGTPSELRFAIYKKLNDAGISMPFPQRDVHFDANHPVPVTVIPPSH